MLAMAGRMLQIYSLNILMSRKKYRTKHFVGLLDSGRVRNNGQQEIMKY